MLLTANIPLTESKWAFILVLDEILTLLSSLIRVSNFYPVSFRDSFYVSREAKEIFLHFYYILSNESKFQNGLLYSHLRLAKKS